MKNFKKFAVLILTVVVVVVVVIKPQNIIVFAVFLIIDEVSVSNLIVITYASVT